MPNKECLADSAAERYWDAYIGMLRQTRDETLAAGMLERQVQQENPALWAELNAKVAATQFQVRSYGRDRFCYPQHPDLGPVDPYPAQRFPRAVLFTEFLFADFKRSLTSSAHQPAPSVMGR